MKVVNVLGEKLCRHVFKYKIAHLFHTLFSVIAMLISMHLKLKAV